MNSIDKKSIAFLFGAGISQDVLISTSDITNKILTANNIVRLSGRYLEHPQPETLADVDIRDHVPKIKELIKIIMDDFSEHYMFKNNEMTYEDIYYLINALYEDENGEYSNPIVSRYCNLLREKYGQLFKSKYKDFGDLRLIDLTSEALYYIHDIIVSSLYKPDAPTEHLSFLSDVNSDSSFSKIYIFSLNHDILIEKYFNNMIDYSDGFISDGIGHRVWSSKNFSKKITLLKLHGSINWHRMIGKDYYDDKIVIYKTPQRDIERPLIIIGRFNKLQAYTRSINFELQCIFAQQINKTNDLIISGYSFGDQGINSRIIHWALHSKERRIFLIHKDPENLILNARPAIRNMFSFLDKQKKIIFITDYITPATKWFELQKFIL